MNEINLDIILNIVDDYIEKHNITLTEYADRCDISKAWLSRLNNENNKKISLDLAEKLLYNAGYKLKIVENNLKVKKRKLIKK